MNACQPFVSRLCSATLCMAVLAFGSSSCSTVATVPEQSLVHSADEAFSTLSQSFINEYLQLNPVIATTLGEHRYDGFWSDYSLAGEAKIKAFNLKYQKALQAIDRNQLSPDNKVDAAVLENELASRIFEIENVHGLEISALAYIGIISSGLDSLVAHEFSTPAARTETLIQRLQGIPAIVAAAKSRLKSPSQLDTETAIAQTKGVIELCSTGLEPLVKAVPASAEKLQKASREAILALEDLQKFFQKEVLPRSNRDFRIGKQLYDQKMRYDLVDDIQAEVLAAAAHKALDKTLEDMYEVALKLSPELLRKPGKVTKDPKEKRQLVRAVLDRLALDQPTDASLFHDAEQAIASASVFIREKNILTIPDEKCQVIRMPSFNQGVAGAYSQSSGPFESKFENFVALEPPTPADRNSFYREYNKSMLTELMLHEAMPGHCLQAMHAVKTKNPLRSIFGNGPYAEGWAMYIEEVMAHHGFGGNRIRMVQLKLLARAIANTIIDYGVHVQNMSEKQVMRILMEDTFQEKSEAVGKWRRVRLSSVQLTTYFYGYQQFTAMRLAAEKQAGFQEKTFHDQLLGSGAPPLKLLRTRFGI